MPSSVIAEMSYDPARQTLEIEYRGGRGVYRYFDVPFWEWEEFMLAPSKGTYLNETFKPREYPYMKLEGVPRCSHGRGIHAWPAAHERKPAQPNTHGLRLVSSKKA